MFKFRKNKKEEATHNNLMGKLQERQTVINKLDFNFEHLNKYLLKSIAAYLSAVYKQNPSLCEKFVTEKFYQQMTRDMEENKRIFRYSNDFVNIVKAELADQEIESVNYISSITINVRVSAVYHRQNIFTGTIRKIEEVYDERIQFAFKDDGWRIDKIINQNFIHMGDDTIIRL